MARKTCNTQTLSLTIFSVYIIDKYCAFVYELPVIRSFLQVIARNQNYDSLVLYLLCLFKRVYSFLYLTQGHKTSCDKCNNEVFVV